MAWDQCISSTHFASVSFLIRYLLMKPMSSSMDSTACIKRFHGNLLTVMATQHCIPNWYTFHAPAASSQSQHTLQVHHGKGDSGTHQGCFIIGYGARCEAKAMHVGVKTLRFLYFCLCQWNHIFSGNLQEWKEQKGWNNAGHWQLAQIPRQQQGPVKSLPQTCMW